MENKFNDIILNKVKDNDINYVGPQDGVRIVNIELWPIFRYHKMVIEH